MSTAANEKRTILVADDDADTRAIVTSAIQMLGHNSVEAADGRQALSLSRELGIDLAVLDIMMPEVNGNEVCQSIKQSEFGPYIPVLMLTARDNVKDKVSSLDGGADDYLTKPFHYQELQARIRALLRVRELNERLRSQNDQLKAMQATIVSQERQLLVNQLAGTAAHQLGQPLSAILLNCHVIETLPAGDPRAQRSLAAIKQDAKRMAEMIERLRSADASKTQSYHGKTAILELDDTEKTDTNKTAQ
ncbi:MAG: response regulator [Oligoflexia bacterium]|nr:response regulator [Oligoflexia bacterium]